MKRTVLAAGFLVVSLLAVACNPATPPTPVGAPSPATGDAPLKVEAKWTGSYSKDIQPIFAQYCVRCHGQNVAENGLRLDSYEGVMKGTQFGPVVVPGQPGSSTVAYLIQGISSEKIAMPHQQPQLTPNRIQNIIYWIQAGAKND
ncbi:MAG: c-type cytochrome domain-containing protein [Dehalococcoidia bacterium]|nr:c-type cytochrome domain-containing protein [Dehalococcoidia bacterium]